MFTVKSITINGIHKVDHVRYEFDQNTYICGPNGVGKSTILTAIQLALLGKIPGQSATNAAIFRHANKPTMSVSLELNDDNNCVTITRSWTTKRNSISANLNVIENGMILSDDDASAKIANIVGNASLPIYSFAEFTALSANKMKDWFSEFLPTAKVDETWIDVLTEALPTSLASDTDYIAEIANQLPQPLTTDNIKKANTYIKSCITAKKADIARLTSTIQSLTYYDELDNNQTEESISADINNLIADQQLASSYKFAAAQNYTVNKLLEDPKFANMADSPETDPEYIECKSALTELEENDHALSKEAKENTSAIDSAATELWRCRKIIDSNGVCPYSNAACDSILKSAKERAYVLNDNLSVLKLKNSKVQDMLSEIRAKIEMYVAKLAEIKQRYAHYNELMSRRMPLPDITGHVLEDPSYYPAAIQQKTNELAQLRANIRYNTLMNDLTKEKYISEIELNCLKAWDTITGPNGLPTQMLTDQFNHLAVKISELMEVNPLMMRSTATFNLSSDSNTFSFGIIRDGKYIPFDLLSTGEQCVFFVAFIDVLQSESSSQLKLILIDDLLDHLDAAKFDAFIDSSMPACSSQIIAAGVRNVSDRSGILKLN